MWLHLCRTNCCTSHSGEPGYWVSTCGQGALKDVSHDVRQVQREICVLQESGSYAQIGSRVLPSHTISVAKGNARGHDSQAWISALMLDVT